MQDAIARASGVKRPRPYAEAAPSPAEAAPSDLPRFAPPRVVFSYDAALLDAAIAGLLAEQVVGLDIEWRPCFVPAAPQNRVALVQVRPSVSAMFCRRMPSAPHTPRKRAAERAGTMSEQVMNWPRVRPREILAIKMPTNGPHEIHQPQ